jgi:hypothetical protein
LLEAGHVRADLDAAGAERFDQSADFVALVENALLRGVWFSRPPIRRTLRANCLAAIS